MLGGRAHALGLTDLWVSPLQRAQQTAAPLAGPRETLAFLEEVQVPPISGMKPEDIAARYAGNRERGLSDWWDGIEGGESNRDFVERIATGWDDQMASLGFRWKDRENHRVWYDIPRDGVIGIVCHAGTTGASLAHLLGVPQVPWTWLRFGLWHAGIASIETVPVSDGLVSALQSFNDLEHLTAAHRTR